MTDYWRKQESDQPLFPDILWSRPESRTGAGKLAIIGGNTHAFAAPGQAYNEALSAGVGVCKVLLPDSLQKMVRHVLPDAEYGPSNPSGSFSKQALDSFADISSWSDAALLAGDLGRNSETAVLLEQYVNSYGGRLIVTQDAADYFKETPKLVADRPQTLLVISLAQLQRMIIATPSLTPITYSMNTVQLVEALHAYTTEHTATIITKHNDLLFIAWQGQVITAPHQSNMWRVNTAARMSVFWLQNPDKLLEACASALVSQTE